MARPALSPRAECLTGSPPFPYGQNPVVGPLGLRKYTDHGEETVDFTTVVRYAMPEDEHGR